MQYLGHLRNKKSKMTLYVDNVDSPQFLFVGPLSNYNGSLCYGNGSSTSLKIRENYMERKFVKVFQIKFSITSDGMSSTVGGFNICISDVETQAKYPVYSKDIVYLMSCMQRRDSEYLIQRGEYLEGIFAMVANGSNISLRLLQPGELNFLEGN